MVASTAASSMWRWVTSRIDLRLQAPELTPAFSQRRHEGLRVGADVADLDHHDVGIDQLRIGQARIDRVQPLGEALGTAVIVGKPVDHRLEPDEAGRRHDAGLPHAAADHAAIGARASR